MMDTTQHSENRRKARQGNARLVTTVSANWQINDPQGAYREKVRAAREKYSSRFRKGEIRNNSDFIRWLVDNVDTLMAIPQPTDRA